MLAIESQWMSRSDNCIKAIRDKTEFNFKLNSNSHHELKPEKLTLPIKVIFPCTSIILLEADEWFSTIQRKLSATCGLQLAKNYVTLKEINMSQSVKNIRIRLSAKERTDFTEIPAISATSVFST